MVQMQGSLYILIISESDYRMKSKGVCSFLFLGGENSKFKKGYGLGLSIVKKIIDVHGGTINYHSLATDINRFSIYLPAK